MNVVITESAADDISDGANFYEEQLAGLDDEFQASILADVRRLTTLAGVHEVRFDRFYRAPARRFPYFIYYRVEEGAVYVYSVADDRRDPQWITDRLQ